MSATVCEQCGKRVSKNNVNIHGICLLCVAHNKAASAIKKPEKKCTKCGEVKSLDDFYRQREKKDGRTSQCKTCANKHQRERSARMAKNKLRTEGEKICTKCKKEKDVSEFSKNKNTHDGLQYHCKECHRNYDEVRAYKKLKSQPQQSVRLKQCGRCKETKPHSDFYDDAYTKDGKRCHCITCAKVAYRRRKHLKEMATHEATTPKNTANLNAATRLKTEVNNSKQETINAVKEAKEIAPTPTEIKPKTNWNIHIPYIAVIAALALITVLTLTQTAQ